MQSHSLFYDFKSMGLIGLLSGADSGVYALGVRQ